MLRKVESLYEQARAMLDSLFEVEVSKLLEKINMLTNKVKANGPALQTIQGLVAQKYMLWGVAANLLEFCTNGKANVVI